MDAEYLNKKNSKVIDPLAALRAQRGGSPTAPKLTSKCPKCRADATMAPQRYSYEVYVPRIGKVERYTQLCDICREELSNKPVKTFTRRSRKGRTSREQNGSNNWTIG